MSTQELFSHKVKAEAASNVTGKKKCDACLAGMLLFCREFSPEGILFQTENRDVRNLFVRLVSHAAGEGSVTVTKRERSPKLPLYSMRIKRADDIEKLLERAEITADKETRGISLLKPLSDKNFGAFASGVFLSCGSVVSPEKEYHLEFVAPSQRLCEELCGMFSGRMGIAGRMIQRRSSFVLYFKESEQIEDILTLIGAPKSSLELMNVKIYKDIRNRVNRATNCDTANLGRQNRSSQRQVEAINRIIASEGGLTKLPDELRELCELRLKNPEMSLSELCGLFEPPLSRSGVNHRFERIEQIAKETEE